MMQLVLTVLAIALASLLAVGGINYFSTDIGVRVEVAQGLRAQHDIMTAALTNYRLANNGYIPTSVERLTGFLPDGKIPTFPKTPEAFAWSISKPSSGSGYWLCLEAGDSTPSRTAREGVASFVKDRLEKFPGTVYYGKPVTGAKEHGCKLAGESDHVDPLLLAKAADDPEALFGPDQISAYTMISIQGN